MVIPIGDYNPTRRTPWVTRALLAVNIVVFVLLEPWRAGPCLQQEFFLRWATVPAELTQGEPLDASETAVTTSGRCRIQPFPEKNIYLAVLFSMFLHAGWLHLVGNMLYLVIFGNNVEDRFGHLRYLAFYLLSGAVATVVFVLPNANSLATVVGASGAIAGVLGAYLVLFPRARVTSLVPFLFFIPIELPALIVLGLWFVLQLDQLRLGDMAGSGVAYLAHVAGFVFGMLVTLPARRGLRSRPARRPQPPYWYR